MQADSFYTEFVKDTKNDLETTLHVVIPNRIESIGKLLEKYENSSCVDDSKDGVNIYSGKIECNEMIRDLNDTVKREINGMVSVTDTVELWISFCRAPEENGNPIGDEIQKEILKMLDSVKQSSTDVVDSIMSYYEERIRILGLLKETPFVEDYRKGIYEIDSAHYLSCCQHLREVRNVYCKILDKVEKNYDKLANPKGIASELHHELMY